MVFVIVSDAGSAERDKEYDRVALPQQNDRTVGEDYSAWAIMISVSSQEQKAHGTDCCSPMDLVMRAGFGGGGGIRGGIRGPRPPPRPVKPLREKGRM